MINLKNNCTNTITGNVNTISPYSCTLYKNKTCSNYTTIVHEKLSRLLLNIFEYSNVFADNSCLSPASLFFSFSCCCCSFVVRNKGNPLIRKGKLRKKISLKIVYWFINAFNSKTHNFDFIVHVISNEPFIVYIPLKRVFQTIGLCLWWPCLPELESIEIKPFFNLLINYP